MTEREPADGVAEILHLIEAAREFVHTPAAKSVAEPFAKMKRLVAALDRRYASHRPEPESVGWHPRTWRELVAGDQVAVGDAQATVLASITNHWHVDPRSNEYRPTALEHSVTMITLDYRPGEPYSMPPDGEVETLRGPAGQAVDEANGFRSALHEEPIDVMASWAQDAADTLAAAGLGPVEVI